MNQNNIKTDLNKIDLYFYLQDLLKNELNCFR